jgi:proteasome lid subunit RPN8/RPN11
MASGKARLTAEAERVNPVVPVHIWRSPAGADSEVIVVAELEVYVDIYNQSAAALPNETGGFLLGQVGWDSGGRAWLVHIQNAVPIEPAEQTPVHFSFTWRDVDRVRGQRERQGKALVGWYHTHPDMGIFLSETDLEKTHRVLFSEPFQIALVYDPVSSRAGYFFWEGPQQLDATPARWREFTIAIDKDLPEQSAAVPVETPNASPQAGDELEGAASEHQLVADSGLVRQFRQAALTAAASIPSQLTPSPGPAGAGPAGPGSKPAASPDQIELQERTPTDTQVPAARTSSATATGVRPPFGFFAGIAMGLVSALILLIAYLLWAR